MPNQLLINQEKEHQLTLFKSIAEKKFTRILGDLGADSGARESRNGRKKVTGKTKSPWGKCISRVVPNGQARSDF